MSYRPVHRVLLLRSLLTIGAVTASACVDAPTTVPRSVTSEGASAAKQTTSSSRILFVRNSPNDIQFQVAIMNDDGGQQLTITNFFAVADASWAPDGKRILFEGNLNSTSPLDVVSMNSDGTGVTFYHLESLCPFFAVPLGKDIMFIDACNGTLYRMRADGTGLTTLATHVQNVQPSADAQGRTVAVTRDGDIVLVDVASGAVTNVTNTPNSFEYSPAFSPSGKQLAFNRCDGAKCDVWVMNADGTNATLVAKDGNNPRWSPDGKRIAFSRLDATNEWDLFTMSADGTGVTNLTKTGNISEFVTAWASY